MIVVYFNMHWMPCFTYLNLVHYCAHKTGPRYFNSFQQDWLALVALNPSMTGWNGLKWIEPVRGSTLMYTATANALQRQEFGTIGASTSRVGAFVEEGSWSVHLHGVSLAQLGLCWPMSVLPLFSYSMLFDVIWILNFWHSEAKGSIRSLSRRHDDLTDASEELFQSKVCWRAAVEHGR